MRYLIVNADDFGASSGINRGIAEAAATGIVNSASLMVNMPGTPDAAARARDFGDVSIGLHVNLTNEGEPVVDPDNTAACAAEIAAQFRRFVDLMGGPPTHLDAHHNIFRRENLLPYFEQLAAEHGIPLREHSAVRYFPDFYGQWDGETHPEQISVENLLRMLWMEVKDGCTELSCHPGYCSSDFSSPYSREREIELRTLCHPGIPKTVREYGIQFINYRRLREIELDTAQRDPCQKSSFLPQGS